MTPFEAALTVYTAVVIIIVVVGLVVLLLSMMEREAVYDLKSHTLVKLAEEEIVLGRKIILVGFILAIPAIVLHLIN